MVELKGILIRIWSESNLILSIKYPQSDYEYSSAWSLIGQKREGVFSDRKTTVIVLNCGLVMRKGALCVPVTLDLKGLDYQLPPLYIVHLCLQFLVDWKTPTRSSTEHCCSTLSFKWLLKLLMEKMQWFSWITQDK